MDGFFSEQPCYRIEILEWIIFHYKGVMVENHSHLLMPSHRRTERAIDDFLVGEAENSRL